MLCAAIGLGGNLGDREANLRAACAAIAALGGVSLKAKSRLYDTEAVILPGSAPQPRFLNAAITVDTWLEPLGLLDGLLAIEHALGRVRRARWDARPIDLDLLWAERDGVAIMLETARLTLPHPRLAERAFALAPLLDVMPHLRERYAEALAQAGGRPSSRSFDPPFGEPVPAKG